MPMKRRPSLTKTTRYGAHSISQSTHTLTPHFYLQGNFANPVYESMYADAIAEPAIAEIAHSTAPDERKGLLQHTHDETHTPDIL